MKKIQIINKSKSRTIFSDAEMTENFKDRFMGLMFKKLSPDFSALVIDRCDAIHTFFMRFNLDLIFLNREGVVLKIVKELKPYRISPFVSKAYYVIEIASGKIDEEDFREKDVIEIKEI